MDFLVERLACSHKRADVSSKGTPLGEVVEVTTFLSLQTNQKHFKGHLEKQPASAFRIYPLVVGQRTHPSGRSENCTILSNINLNYLTFHKERDRLFKIEYCLKNAYGSS